MCPSILVSVRLNCRLNCYWNTHRKRFLQHPKCVICNPETRLSVCHHGLAIRVWCTYYFFFLEVDGRFHGSFHRKLPLTLPWRRGSFDGIGGSFHGNSGSFHGISRSFQLPWRAVEASVPMEASEELIYFHKPPRSRLKLRTLGLRRPLRKLIIFLH